MPTLGQKWGDAVWTEFTNSNGRKVGAWQRPDGSRWVDDKGNLTDVGTDGRRAGYKWQDPNSSWDELGLSAEEKQAYAEYKKQALSSGSLGSGTSAMGMGQWAQANHLGTYRTQEANDAKASEDKTTSDIDEFYRHMSAPLDENDPDVIEIRRAASGAANNEAKRRGLQGGIVASEAGRLAGQGTMANRQFRQGLAAQALALKNNRSLGLAELGEKKYQFDANGAYNQSRQDMANRQGVGQTIGAVAGGALGAYVGGPAGLAAGSQVGAGIGGAIGGGSTPAYHPPTRKNSGGGY